MIRWVKMIAAGLISLAVGGAHIYFTWPEKTPPNNFWCDFQDNKGNQPRTFGNLNAKITSVRITGLARKSTQETLYNFSGSASVLTATKSVNGPVQGSVFIDKSGQPNGLLLWISSSAFGSNELSVTTLDRDGILDFNSSEAFFHIGPNRGVADRLSYPVTMNCSAKLQDEH